MKYFQLIVYLFFVFETVAQPTDSWPIFRGDQNLKGVSKTVLPAAPKLLWTFTTGDIIKSAPVVANGKVVIGSTDGFVYCLDLKGKQVWKFETGNAIEAPALNT
jgi:eukaryotic-like serine/threonine-protein kinase